MSIDKVARPKRCLVADAHLDWHMDQADVEEIGRITHLQGQELHDLISELEPAIDFARAMHAADHEAPDQSGRIAVALQSLIAKLEPAIDFARTFSATDGTPEENMRINAALQDLVAWLEPTIKLKQSIPAAEGQKPSEVARDNFQKREALAFLIIWLQRRALQRLITRLRGQVKIEGLIATLEAAIEFARTLDIGEVKNPLLRELSRALRPVQRALDKGKPPHKLRELLLRQDDRNPSLDLWERVGRGDLAENLARHFQSLPESGSEPCHRPYSIAEHSLIHDVHAAMVAADVKRISSYQVGPLVKVLQICYRIACIQKFEESESIPQHLKRYLPGVRGKRT